MKNGAYGPKNTSNFYLSEQRDNGTSVLSLQSSFQQLGSFGGYFHLDAREGLDLETAEFYQWYVHELSTLHQSLVSNMKFHCQQVCKLNHRLVRL
jgi:hypothetical protein